MAQKKDSAGAAAERDLVRTYLEEIGRTPLLDAEQEVELSKAIEAGLYGERLLAERAAEPESALAPGAPTAAELAKLVEAGQRAKDAFLRANLRLVVSVARKYGGRGVPLLDLIQEGNLGLVRAVEKFDYRKGFKFSTYATWWIRQAVGRAVAEQSRTIRVPVAVAESLARLTRARRDLLAELDREPTEAELAEALDLPVQRVAELRGWVRDPVSLDLVVGDDEESTLGDFIGDSDLAANPEELVIAADARDQLRELLDRLEPRYADILRWRYGLVDGRTHTLTEVGERCGGLNRESVRRAEREALAQLRTLAGDRDPAAA
jgi:RNA polymerase sigma factor (sigma-70 family)